MRGYKLLPVYQRLPFDARFCVDLRVVNSRQKTNPATQDSEGKILKETVNKLRRKMVLRLLKERNLLFSVEKEKSSNENSVCAS